MASQLIEVDEARAIVLAQCAPLDQETVELARALGRPLHDLRISVTDRCNMRCGYCMPREVFGAGFAFLERSQLLSFEEIARLVRLAAPLGVRKLRLTGGEPLLRRAGAAVRQLRDGRVRRPRRRSRRGRVRCRGWARGRG